MGFGRCLALLWTWGVALTLVLLRAPEAPIAAGGGHEPGRHARLRVVDVLPRLPDYVRCFALMAIPGRPETPSDLVNDAAR